MTTTDKPSISALQEREQAMDRAPWYSAENRWRSDCVLIGPPDADGESMGRVVAQANQNFPYRANLDGIVDLRNAAPVLLEIVAAALALHEQEQVAAKARAQQRRLADRNPDYEWDYEAIDRDDRTTQVCRVAYGTALTKVRR